MPRLVRPPRVEAGFAVHAFVGLDLAAGDTLAEHGMAAAELLDPLVDFLLGFRQPGELVLRLIVNGAPSNFFSSRKSSSLRSWRRSCNSSTERYWPRSGGVSNISPSLRERFSTCLQAASRREVGRPGVPVREVLTSNFSGRADDIADTVSNAHTLRTSSGRPTPRPQTCPRG
jgi:hypothetical protein